MTYVFPNFELVTYVSREDVLICSCNILSSVQLFSLFVIDGFLQYPRILWGNFFIVIFMNASFAETMAFIEAFGILVGDLYVEGYARDLRLVMDRRSLHDALEGLGTQLA